MTKIDLRKELKHLEEPATVEKMHAFAQENGYRLRGKHHEIYLGDPMRAAPEKLRTILRQPVELVAGETTTR